MRKPVLLHCLQSGLSYGIFDKEYRFKRPESVATGRAIYWHEIDSHDPSIEEAGRQRLLGAMDSPLVSFALSYDKAVPLPPGVAAALAQFIPEYKHLRTIGSAGSSNAGKMTEEPRKGEVLIRGGIGTRKEYLGQGLMKAISYYVMHDAHARGFKKIEISVANAIVSKVWLSPPVPYWAELIYDRDLRQGEVEIEGKMVKLFSALDSGFFQVITIYLGT
jgi:hypothetical protein